MIFSLTPKYAFEDRVKMLGRLLHLGSGGSASHSALPSANNSRPVSSLESVQEDIHTRNLLFPDAQALFQHRNDQVFPLSANSAAPTGPATSNSYDCSEDVDLDVCDVRVLIMQDNLAHLNAALLYDSHPAPSPQPSAERPPPPEPRRTPASSRKGSLVHPSRPLVIQPDSSQPRQGAFDRRGSLHGRAQSYMETESQRAAREYREELATFSSCIFGHSELMSYKGTSTKVHVVPAESSRLADHPTTVLGDGRSSIGRSSARSSKLSQSFTSNTFAPPGAPASGTFSRPAEKKKVLITRLFPVTLANDELDPEVTPVSRFTDDNSGFPFPPTADDVAAKKKVSQPRQLRTPMYAVVLVVQLPSARTSTAATPKSAFRESGSYNEQDFFSSSLNSSRPSWWNPTPEATNSSCAIDVEDRIDSLTQHWDIVMRTLTHLQSIVATTLRTMLKQADVSSPDPFTTPVPPNLRPPRNPSSDRRNSDNIRVKTPKSTHKFLSLSPNCLSTDVVIAAEVNISRRRIVTGLKASRVVTGQGRWGIWRDEAIWTFKWTQSQGPFMYNLFTGFLATHTDWLQTLCPPFYRRRYFDNRRSRADEDLSLPARTVIVSEDKMAARRLIFLLSAFMPANQQLPTNRVHRASTSASTSGFGNSPPTYVVPVLREESLRRKINRRTGGNRRASHSTHSRTTSQSTRGPAQMGHLGMESVNERRASDAASIRTTSLAMPGNDMISRKSTAAITTTIMPETTMPHFSSAQRVDSSRRPRPDSSGSIARDDLRRSLKRGESSGHVSTASNDSRTSRWGSVISGLWSPRRRESTGMSSPGDARDPKSPTKSASCATFRRDRLSEMVKEAGLLEYESAIEEAPETVGSEDVTTPRESVRRERKSFAQADRTIETTGAFESPVKTSVNQDDGVIDVDFPFPDYIASFESAISSPSSSGYLSTPGLGGGLDYFEQSARVSVEGDLPLNAAGWLSRFHPDFALQAIPPQDDLIDQVKATLRAEPTPGPSPQSSQQSSQFDLPQRWVDIGSAVIADTTTNTVHRITFRRLVKQKHVDRAGNGNTPSFAVAPHTPSVLPYETPIEEEWIEETVLMPDEFLVQAMDKVMRFNSEPTKESLLPSHQAQGETYGSDSDNTIPESLSEPPPTASLEVPRVQCKAVILSALEEIIRDAVDRHEGRSSDIIKGANGRHRDSVLHGAVRNWLSSIDTVE